MSRRRTSHRVGLLCQPSFLSQCDGRSRSALFALWLDADSVIHGGPDALPAAEVSLRGLDREVAQQELYLLQFTARRVASALPGTFAQLAIDRLDYLFRCRLLIRPEDHHGSSVPVS